MSNKLPHTVNVLFTIILLAYLITFLDTLPTVSNLTECRTNMFEPEVHQTQKQLQFIKGDLLFSYQLWILI